MSRKPATPSFRSSSYGKKQSKIPLSSANYASMHPRKENMLTPITKNSTALDSIDKRRAAQISLYTLMNSGSVKAACKSNSAASRKIESTVATPSAHSTHKRCARPTKTPSKVTNRVNNQPMATPSKITKATYKQPVATPSKAANGVNKTSETPSVKRSSKSLSAYKNKLQSPTIPSPFTFRTEERAARRKQAIKLEDAQEVQLQTTLKEKAEIEFRRLRQSFCFKARPLPSFYNERASPKSPLEKTVEEKFNEKDAQKVQLQTTLKVIKPLILVSNLPFIFCICQKAESEFRRLRQSFCFKARPLPNFYNERATPKSPLKKVCLDSITQKEP
ncbi:hypothetical protein Tco_1352520 [Tanacetum coccineum]